jgi:ABC-2 type transport system permease protein
MTLFFKYLLIQLKIDIREKGTLLVYYVVPLVFYVVLGSVFANISPAIKSTLAATMIIFAITMGAVLGAPGPIVKMREIGILRGYMVNGISNGMVLLVHAVSAFLHVFLVSVIIYLTSPIMFKSDYPKNPVWFFGIILILLFTSTALGLLIGVISRDNSFATMLSQVIFLPSLLLSGIMFPSSMLPKALIWVGRIFPATHADQSFMGLAFGNHTDINDKTSLIILASIGLAALALVFVRVRVMFKEEIA